MRNDTCIKICTTNLPVKREKTRKVKEEIKF